MHSTVATCLLNGVSAWISRCKGVPNKVLEGEYVLVNKKESVHLCSLHFSTQPFSCSASALDDIK